MPAPKFQPAPPRQQPLLHQDSTLTDPWYRWLGLVAPRLTSPVVASTPATSADQGIAGQITYDTNFLYLCVATNTWRRIPLNAF